MNNGYIPLNRKFFDSTYWKAKRKFSFAEAWLDLIQMARYQIEPGEILLPSGRIITIRRGEARASIRFLSERWDWGENGVRVMRFLNKHIEIKEIERRMEQGESIIKLCNYDYYNPISDANRDTDSDANRDTDSDANRDTDSDKEEEGIIKSNKENKENKEKDISTKKDFEFENFFDSYHKITGLPKTDKQAALKQWNKLNNTEKEKAMDSVQPFYDSLRNKDYCKKCRTYLSDKNFNDEFTPPVLPSKSMDDIVNGTSK